MFFLRDMIFSIFQIFYIYAIQLFRLFNKSNTKISTHYQILCLYPINICDDIFVSYEFFYSIWNMFNSKIIKMGYNIIIHMQSYPMSSYWFKRFNASRYIIYTPSFVLSKLFLEKTSLNLASIWWHYCISKLV